MELDGFFRDSWLNMVLSWSITLLVAAVLFESVLGRDILWTLFSVSTLVLVLLPPLAYRNRRAMLPFEVLAIASIPIIVRAFEVSVLANQVATYTAMAAVALIIAVELNMFTEVNFNHGFAIGFVIVSTLALSGAWSILRFTMDSHMGTSFLTTNDALMEEYLNVLAAGLFSGILFDSYFRRRGRRLVRNLRQVMSV